MGSEKSDEDRELPQATERVIPLESERAKMLSVGPDTMAQPVTVPEEKCLPRALLIFADEMCEEKEERSVDVPSDMLDMLRKPHERELVLRLLTFLANIATFATHFVDGSSKPTLLSVLYHFNKTTELSDLAALINDQDEDLSFQAKRLHDALLGIS
ncbi:arm_2 domain-containing protein [Trichonephila clavipes]|nr:arm_2 domain-containing protein [Trichonephila clavipes]